MSVMCPSMGPGAGLSASQVIPVSLLVGDSGMPGLTTLNTFKPDMGPGPPLPSSPVSLLGKLS